MTDKCPPPPPWARYRAKTLSLTDGAEVEEIPDVSGNGRLSFQQWNTAPMPVFGEDFQGGGPALFNPGTQENVWLRTEVGTDYLFPFEGVLSLAQVIHFVDGLLSTYSHANDSADNDFWSTETTERQGVHPAYVEAFTGSDGAWINQAFSGNHLVVYTVGGGELKIHIDDEVVATGSATEPSTFLDAVEWLFRSFEGVPGHGLREWMIYDSELESAQLAQLYDYYRCEYFGECFCAPLAVTGETISERRSPVWGWT